jgi:hypothetical protein
LTKLPFFQCRQHLYDEKNISLLAHFLAQVSIFLDHTLVGFCGHQDGVMRHTASSLSISAVQKVPV